MYKIHLDNVHNTFLQYVQHTFVKCTKYICTTYKIHFHNIQNIFVQQTK